MMGVDILAFSPHPDDAELVRRLKVGRPFAVFAFNMCKDEQKRVDFRLIFPIRTIKINVEDIPQGLPILPCFRLLAAMIPCHYRFQLTTCQNPYG